MAASTQLQVSHSHLSIASLTDEPLDKMCSVETAPMIKAVVVGKGADFSNYPDDEDDGQPVMPQVSAQRAHPHPHSPHSCSTTTQQAHRPALAPAYLVSTVLQLLRADRAHVGSCWRGQVLLAVASSPAGSRPLVAA